MVANNRQVSTGRVSLALVNFVVLTFDLFLFRYTRQMTDDTPSHPTSCKVTRPDVVLLAQVSLSI